MRYINEDLNRMLTVQALEAAIEYISEYISEYEYNDDDYYELEADALYLCSKLTVKTAFNALELGDHIDYNYAFEYRISYPEYEGYEAAVILVDNKKVVYEDLINYNQWSGEYGYDRSKYYVPRHIHCSVLIEEYYDFVSINSEDVAIYKPYIVERPVKANNNYTPTKSIKWSDYDDNDLPF